MTRRTDDTFHDDADVRVSFAEPFDWGGTGRDGADLRKSGWVVNDGGTLVAIRGPRYSTRAESRWYAAQGWDLISMTPYPEAALAREIGIAYTSVALVTSHDALADTPWPVTQENSTEIVAENARKLREALLRVAVQLAVSGS